MLPQIHLFAFVIPGKSPFTYFQTDTVSPERWAPVTNDRPELLTGRLTNDRPELLTGRWNDPPKLRIGRRTDPTEHLMGRRNDPTEPLIGRRKDPPEPLIGRRKDPLRFLFGRRNDPPERLIRQRRTHLSFSFGRRNDKPELILRWEGHSWASHLVIWAAKWPTWATHWGGMTNLSFSLGGGMTRSGWYWPSCAVGQNMLTGRPLDIKKETAIKRDCS